MGMDLKYWLLPSSLAQHLYEPGRDSSGWGWLNLCSSRLWAPLSFKYKSRTAKCLLSSLLTRSRVLHKVRPGCKCVSCPACVASWRHTTRTRPSPSRHPGELNTVRESSRRSHIDLTDSGSSKSNSLIMDLTIFSTETIVTSLFDFVCTFGLTWFIVMQS